MTGNPSRWAQLVTKYGILGAIGPFFTGEKIAKLTETQTRLTWYAQALIIVTSIAALFVFGDVEFILIFHYGMAIISAILAIPLVVLFVIVYSMDRTFIATIPRIPLLARRHQWGMFMEHVSYAVCVSAIEALTFGLVIYTIENNVQAIVQGESVVPKGIIWLFGLVVARAILAVWTYWHAFFVSEELPVQWGTVEHKMLGLLGAQIMIKVGQLELAGANLADLMRVQMMILQPVPRAPFTWNREHRRIAQAALNKTHQEAIIDAVQKIYEALPASMPSPHTLIQEYPQDALPPGPDDVLDHVPEVVDRQIQSAPRNLIPLRRAIRNATAKLQQERRAVTLYNIASEVQASTDTVLTTINQMVTDARRRLRPGEQITDQTLSTLGALVSSETIAN